MDTPSTIEFVPFQKIGRVSRNCTITEKIDGTNACIFMDEAGAFLTGSRTRWITPEDDNAGFSKWAHANRADLLTLGPGFHYGEWWGLGIQRAYGQTGKRFSLFNATRWSDELGQRPACCSVVPILYQGIFETTAIGAAVAALRLHGSKAAHGFMRPEGVVVYHHATKQLFKKTLEKDEKPKGSNEES